MNTKQPQQLQEALQRYVQGAVARSVAQVTAAPSPYSPSVRLAEPLQICLLAVAHRYPEHSLEINEAVLGPQAMATEGWRAGELLMWLQKTAPALLQEEAPLEVTLQRRGIYLLSCSQETPALWVRGTQEGEKRPITRNHLAEMRPECVWDVAG